MSSVAAFMTVSLIFPTLITGKEKPQPPQLQKSKNVFAELLNEFKQMDKIFYRAMLPRLIGTSYLNVDHPIGIPKSDSDQFVCFAILSSKNTL